MFGYRKLPNTGGGGSLIEFHLLGKIISIEMNTCTTLQLKRNFQYSKSEIS